MERTKNAKRVARFQTRKKRQALIESLFDSIGKQIKGKVRFSVRPDGDKLTVDWYMSPGAKMFVRGFAQAKGMEYTDLLAELDKAAVDIVVRMARSNLN